MKTSRIAVTIFGAIAATGTSILLPTGSAYAATQLFTAQDVDNWNKALPEIKPLFKNNDQNTRGAEADTGPSCHAIPKTDAPSSPTINIVSPTLDKPLAAPVDIKVKFATTDADGIRPTTFKVCYLARFMTVDITDKIAGKVAVSPEGLEVAGADLPSGHHHLVMLIEDNGGHVGRQEATFDIK